MFVILVYDIGAKRVSKVRKLCKNFLVPVQKSVFEGEILESKLNNLKNQLRNVIDKDVDSVIIYHLDSMRYAKKEQIGIVTITDNIL